VKPPRPFLFFFPYNNSVRVLVLIPFLFLFSSLALSTSCSMTLTDPLLSLFFPTSTEEMDERLDLLSFFFPLFLLPRPYGLRGRLAVGRYFVRESRYWATLLFFFFMPASWL